MAADHRMHTCIPTGDMLASNNAQFGAYQVRLESGQPVKHIPCQWKQETVTDQGGHAVILEYFVNAHTWLDSFAQT